jgi:hypothetical protein
MLNDALHEIQNTSGSKKNRLEMQQVQERRMRRQRRQARSARRYIDGWSVRMF